MKNILDWFRKNRQPEPDSPEKVADLVKMLAMTEAQEMACDDVYLVLAEFAEMNQRGEDVEKMMPLVKQHLALCPDCREEYEALMNALAAEEYLLD